MIANTNHTANTKHSSADTGTPRLRRTRQQVKDGYFGPGRRKLLPSGHTRLVWWVDGSHTTPMNISLRASLSVREAQRLEGKSWGVVGRAAGPGAGEEELSPIFDRISCISSMHTLYNIASIRKADSSFTERQ